MTRIPINRVDHEPSLRPCLSLFVRVAYHGGETAVLLRRDRRPEVAESLEALLQKHLTGTVYVAWSNHAHEGEEVQAILRTAGPLGATTCRNLPQPDGRSCGRDRVGLNPGSLDYEQHI